MRKTTTHKWFALVLALIFVLAFAITPALAEQTRLDMFNYLSRTKLDLEPYRGKAIFLNFFTGWCPYCVVELPDIKKIHEAYSQEELEVILVHVWDGEDASVSESLREEYGLEALTFFEDEDMGVARAIGLPGYPTSLFIDQEGYLAKAIPSALNFEQISAILDELGVSLAPVEDAALTSAPQEESHP